MTKANVYVTKPLPPEALALLREHCEVEVNFSGVLPKDELLEKLKGRDAVVVVGGTPIDDEVCQAVKAHCKIFSVHGVGYNNVDIAAATKAGILVSYTPEVVTDATADLAWTLMMSAARRVVECDKFVRSGQKGWGPTNMIGTQISGKTLGIMGGGRIGTAVGERGIGFKMRIIYTDVQPNPVFEAATGGKFVDKETLLKEADFISIHTPLLPSTRHFMSTNEFKMMKPTAIFVNAARGPVVDEKALVAALKSGEIAGAGLDVFEFEPNLEPGLAELDNVVLTPHIGTSTMDTRIQMGELCARNVFAALEGQVPPTCLNPEVLKGR
ncbi:MAG: D-glycerate dehydrogenase [Negativicutes bacterium]|nr:D-glycerate dehydrogenase [Negativicutes bacterium]